MRKLLSTIIYVIVIIGVIAILVLGFKAYFMIEVGDNGQIIDGLGRKLTEAPVFVRMFFWSDRLWTGVKWFILDVVMFWVCIFLGHILLSLAQELNVFKENNKI